MGHVWGSRIKVMCSTARTFLVHETLTIAWWARDLEHVFWGLQDRAEPVRPGETIYKGHHSYDLMRNLQLGIIFSIAKSVEQSTGGGLKAPVTDEDFAQQVSAVILSRMLALQLQRFDLQHAASTCWMKVHLERLRLARMMICNCHGRLAIWRKNVYCITLPIPRDTSLHTCAEGVLLQ